MTNFLKEPTPFKEEEKKELKLLIKKKALEEKDFPSPFIYKLSLIIIFSLTASIFIQYGVFKSLFFIVIGYFNHQFTFMIYHSRIHASFKEKVYSELHCREYIAWIHHYIDPKYLVCGEHYRAYLHWKFTLFFPIPTATFLYFLNLGEYGLGVIGSWLFWQTTLAPIHNWYHVKPRYRKRYFSYFEYIWLFLFEKVGLISTKKHYKHHNHGINNLEDAKDFQDAWMPPLIVSLYNNFFRWFQVLYKDGQTNMRTFLKKVILLNYLIGHFLFAYSANIIFKFIN